MQIFGLLESQPIGIYSRVSMNHWLQLSWLGPIISWNLGVDVNWRRLQGPKNLHKISALVTKAQLIPFLCLQDLIYPNNCVYRPLQYHIVTRLPLPFSGKRLYRLLSCSSFPGYFLPLLLHHCARYNRRYQGSGVRIRKNIRFQSLAREPSEQ